MRDLLLVDLADNTGLRRGELANLEVKDLILDQGILVVRKGKGGKDGVVPLIREMTARLKAYVQDMAPHDKVFGLKAASISNKIKWFSRKAGVDLHPHSLRHHFATRLVERGANIRAIQQLLRHENLNATELYLSLSAKGLREVIDLFDEPAPARGMPWESPQTEGERMFSWELPQYQSQTDRARKKAIGAHAI